VLAAADALVLFVRFGWLARLTISDGLSLFRSHHQCSEAQTVFSWGSLRIARWSRKGPPCESSNPSASMSDTQQILQSLDAEIQTLQQARKILTDGIGIGNGRRTNGRRKSKMSAAARARISAAQKKRWAAQKAGTKEK
jgi:hypothetical protein